MHLGGNFNSSAPSIHSPSQFNRNFCHEYYFEGANAKLIITSVTGHIEDINFQEPYNQWKSCSEVFLIEQAKIVRLISESKKQVVKNLQNLASKATDLVIWTDADREGEAIGFEIIRVISQINPHVKIYRARFSANTRQEIRHAMEHLVVPNLAESEVRFFNLASTTGCRDQKGDRSSGRSCIHEIHDHAPLKHTG